MSMFCFYFNFLRIHWKTPIKNKRIVNFQYRYGYIPIYILHTIYIYNTQWLMQKLSAHGLKMAHSSLSCFWLTNIILNPKWIESKLNNAFVRQKKVYPSSFCMTMEQVNSAHVFSSWLWQRHDTVAVRYSIRTIPPRYLTLLCRLI